MGAVDDISLLYLRFVIEALSVQSSTSDDSSHYRLILAATHSHV